MFGHKDFNHFRTALIVQEIFGRYHFKDQGKLRAERNRADFRLFAPTPETALESNQKRGRPLPGVGLRNPGLSRRDTSRLSAIPYAHARARHAVVAKKSLRSL
jgi:hypothetical protein